MANEKRLDTRIINKHDTEENWLKAGLNGFIPKAAEWILYDPDDRYDYFRVKIGDGVTKVHQLSFSTNVNVNLKPGAAENSIQLSDKAATGKGAIALSAHSCIPMSGGDIIIDGEWIGWYNEQIGQYTKASGKHSFTTGISTIAEGIGSVASGSCSKALGNASHAEGASSSDFVSDGEFYYPDLSSWQDGESYQTTFEPKDPTTAEGDASHAEGLGSFAIAKGAHSEGKLTIAGTKGYFYDAIYPNVEANTTTFVLSKRQCTSASYITVLDSLDNIKNAASRPACEYDPAAGKLAYANNDKQYNFTFTIDPERPYLVTMYGKVLTEVKAVAELDSDDYAIHCPEQPHIGVAIIKEASHSEGMYNNATGSGAHAEGGGVNAYGDYSHAEGWNGTTAYHHAAHAEGRATEAYGNSSHTEGGYTKTYSHYAHAEGEYAEAKGNGSHAEGRSTKTDGAAAHAEGKETFAKGTAAHAEGVSAQAIKEAAHAEGKQTRATGIGAHAEGGAESVAAETISWEDDVTLSVVTSGSTQTQNGNKTTHTRMLKNAAGEFSHSEGYNTSAAANYSHSEGQGSNARGKASHAEGQYTQTLGTGAHAEGYNTLAQGDYAHAEGKATEALVKNSHAEGEGTKAYSYWAHAEGKNTVAGNVTSEASGRGAHAEGNQTEATREASHAEGYKTHATGKFSHAEGSNTTASGEASHAGGTASTAKHKNAFVHGSNLQSGAENQAVFGAYNQEDGSARFIVGGGSGDEVRYGAERNTLISAGVYAGGRGEGTYFQVSPHFAIECSDSVLYSSSDTESILNIDGPGLASHYTYYQGLWNSEYDIYENILDYSLSIPGIQLQYKYSVGQTDNQNDYNIELLRIFDNAFSKQQLATLSQYQDTGIRIGDRPTALTFNNTCSALEDYSLAGGMKCTVSNKYSFAYGNNNTVNGEYSVALGRNSIAGEKDENGNFYGNKANYSIVIGEACKARKYWSAAFGRESIANADTQFVIGKYNALNDKAAFIIGNGGSTTARSNLFEVGTANNKPMIKLGNTTVTEEQLQKLLALLDNYTITAVNQ